MTTKLNAILDGCAELGITLVPMLQEGRMMFRTEIKGKSEWNNFQTVGYEGLKKDMAKLSKQERAQLAALNDDRRAIYESLCGKT